MILLLLVDDTVAAATAPYGNACNALPGHEAQQASCSLNIEGFSTMGLTQNPI